MNNKDPEATSSSSNTLGGNTEDSSNNNGGSQQAQSLLNQQVRNNLLGGLSNAMNLNPVNLMSSSPSGMNLNAAALLAQSGIRPNNVNLAAAMNNPTLRLLQQQQLQQRLAAAAALQNANPTAALGLVNNPATSTAFQAMSNANLGNNNNGANTSLAGASPNMLAGTPMNSNGAAGGVNSSSGMAGNPASANMAAVIQQLSATDPVFTQQLAQRMKLQQLLQKMKQDAAQGQPIAGDVNGIARMYSAVHMSINQKIALAMQTMGNSNAMSLLNANGTNILQGSPSTQQDGSPNATSNGMTSSTATSGAAFGGNVPGISPNNLAQLLRMGINPANLTPEQIQLLRQQQHQIQQAALLQQSQQAASQAASPAPTANVPKTPGPMNAGSPPPGAGSPSMTPNNPVFSPTPNIRPNTPQISNGSPMVTPGSVNMANSPSQSGNNLSLGSVNMSPVMTPNGVNMTAAAVAAAAAQNELTVRRAMAASVANQANRAVMIAMRLLPQVPILVSSCDVEISKPDTDMNRKAQLGLLKTELVRNAELFRATSQPDPFMKILKTAYSFLKTSPQQIQQIVQSQQLQQMSQPQQPQQAQSPLQQGQLNSAPSPSSQDQSANMNPTTPGADDSVIQNAVAMTKSPSASKGKASKAKSKRGAKSSSGTTGPTGSGSIGGVDTIANGPDVSSFVSPEKQRIGLLGSDSGSKSAAPTPSASVNSSPRVTGVGPPKGTPGFPTGPQQSTSVFLAQPLHGISEKSTSSQDVLSQGIGSKTTAGLITTTTTSDDPSATIPASVLLSVERKWSSLLHRESLKRPWEFEVLSGSAFGSKKKKKRLYSLLTQLDTYELLDPDAEDILLDVADHFIECVVYKASLAAKHRKSDTVEPKDFQIELERNWNIRVPGFSDELRTSKRPTPNAAHTARINALAKVKREAALKRLDAWNNRNQAILEVEQKWKEADQPPPLPEPESDTLMPLDGNEVTSNAHHELVEVHVNGNGASAIPSTTVIEEVVEEDEVMLEGGTSNPVNVT